mmetsp:Transcript_6054/g.14665  ORF Transcript_6054/g.14665 Transcript_6054/m.14665 type:complete len:225 (+) Transcript_6054:734-1408(+)
MASAAASDDAVVSLPAAIMSWTAHLISWIRTGAPVSSLASSIAPRKSSPGGAPPAMALRRSSIRAFSNSIIYFMGSLISDLALVSNSLHRLRGSLMVASHIASVDLLSSRANPFCLPCPPNGESSSAKSCESAACPMTSKVKRCASKSTRTPPRSASAPAPSHRSRSLAASSATTASVRSRVARLERLRIAAARLRAWSTPSLKTMPCMPGDPPGAGKPPSRSW